MPVEEIVQGGIKYGVRKINIDTDIRLAMTGAIRKFFVENPPSSTRASTSPAREAAKLVCKAWFQLFGTAGNASKIADRPRQDRAGPEPGQSGALNQTSSAKQSHNRGRPFFQPFFSTERLH